MWKETGGGEEGSVQFLRAFNHNKKQHGEGALGLPEIDNWEYFVNYDIYVT